MEQSMERLLYEIGMRVIVVLIATPIVMVITGLTRRTWQRASGAARSSEADEVAPEAQGRAAVPWNTLAYAVVYGALMVGIMELSLAITTQLFNFEAETQWTLGGALVAWGIYLVLSLLASLLAQGLIVASKQSGQGLVERHATQRQRMALGGGMWTKLAFLPVYLGWAALAAPDEVFVPMILGLLTFVIVDVLSLLAMLTGE
jgi:hypothetical protein